MKLCLTQASRQYSVSLRTAASRAVGCKPYRGGHPARPALRTSSPKGSYVRQLLGLTANPPCTQHRATHNGGKVLEMKRVDKKSAQPSKSQALLISSFCCLRCIFEIENRKGLSKNPPLRVA